MWQERGKRNSTDRDCSRRDLGPILCDDYGVREQKQLDRCDSGAHRVVFGVSVSERELVQEVAFDEVVPRDA